MGGMRRRVRGRVVVQLRLRALLMGAFATVAPPATATPDYPGIIQDTLGLECAPICTLCHLDPRGGFNVKTKFGLALRGTSTELLGDPLQAGKNDDLPVALEALARNTCTPSPGAEPRPGKPCDSDGDGTSDIDELKAGRDPNPGGVEFCAGPRYGCGARVARGSSDFDWVALLIAGAAAAALALGARRSG
jgi:hypothetical protein